MSLGAFRLNTLAQAMASSQSYVSMLIYVNDNINVESTTFTLIKTSSNAYRRVPTTNIINTNTNTSTSFNSDNSTLAIGKFESPYIDVYNRSGYSFNKVSSAISTLTSPANSVRWSSTGFLAHGSSTSPYLFVYSRSGDTFTKISNPSTLPAGLVDKIAWNEQSTTIAVSQTASPYILFYNFNGTTLTKIANPSSLPSGATTSGAIAWNSSGTSVAMGVSVSPYINIYNRSSDTFTKLSNPATLPTVTPTAMAWNPSGSSLAIGNSAGLIVYNRSGDTFTSVGTITESITNPPVSIQWSSDGLSLYVTSSSESRIFSRSGDTFTETTTKPEKIIINDSTLSFGGMTSSIIGENIPEVTNGLLNSITIASTATSTTSTITIPSTVTNDDYAILFDTSTTVTNVTPTNWTSISQITTTGIRTNISYKKLTSGDASTSVTGLSGTSRKVMLVVRGSEMAIKQLISGRPLAQATTAVPTNQTTDSSAFILTAPTLYWATYASTGSIATRGLSGGTGTPVEYSSVSTSGIYVKALITNYPNTFTDITASMSDGGTNTLQTGFFEFF